jgi:hypothetical protein
MKGSLAPLINLEGRFLSISATARLLKQDHRKIQRMVRLGRLPGCKLGRNWIVSASLLYKFVSAIVQDYDRSPIGDLVQAPLGTAFSRKHNKLKLFVLKVLKNNS